MNTTTELPPRARSGDGNGQLPSVMIPLNGITLPAELVVPQRARGLVLFTTAAGCIAECPGYRVIVEQLPAAGIATLLFSLLTHAEADKDAHSGYWSFDLDLLTHRLLVATDWVRRQPRLHELGIAYCGTSTAAAAALVAAAQRGPAVQAVVCRSGRPDFAGDSLPRVTAPTLLIVAERDEGIVTLNRRAFARLTCPKRLAVIAGATHLFAEPGALHQVASLATEWFLQHLQPVPAS